MTVVLYGPAPVDDPFRPSRGPNDPFGPTDIGPFPVKLEPLTPCARCQRHIRGGVCIWCQGEEKKPMENKPTVATDQLVAFMRERLAWLDGEIAKAAEYEAEADRIRRMLATEVTTGTKEIG